MSNQCQYCMDVIVGYGYNERWCCQDCYELYQNDQDKWEQHEKMCEDNWEENR